MPTISSISVLGHANELGGSLWNPAIRWTTKHAVFVRISTPSGQTGLGECWCFDAAPDALVAFLSTEVVPAFVGRDLDEVPEIIARLRLRASLTSRHGILASALSGIDIAVHDLVAQGECLSLHKSLATSGPGTAQLYGSGGLYGQGKTTDRLVTEMRDMAAQGHTTVKMKIGALAVKEDLARVNAVLNALPETCSVIIDAVYSYEPGVALKVYEALPSDRIEAFQSPVGAHDLAGMAWLVCNGVPVMGVEAEHRPEIHKAMIDTNAVAFLQTAPIACGGISRVRELCDALTGTPVRLSLEVSSTAVALAAACHLAAADEIIAHVEYHCVHAVFFEYFPLVPVNGSGRRRLPDAAGLGLSVPEAQLTRHFERTQSTNSKIPTRTK